MSYAATMGGRQQSFAGFGYGFDPSMLAPDGSSASSVMPTDSSSSAFTTSGSALDPSVLGSDLLPTDWNSTNPYSPPGSTGGAVAGGAAGPNSGNWVTQLLGGIGAGVSAALGGGSSAPATAARQGSNVSYLPPASSSSMLSGTAPILLAVAGLAAVLIYSHRDSRTAAASSS